MNDPLNAGNLFCNRYPKWEWLEPVERSIDDHLRVTPNISHAELMPLRRGVMAQFTGTNGTDTFNGTDNVVDRFDFTPTTLSSADTASGGGGPVSDLFVFDAGGTVSASAFAHV